MVAEAGSRRRGIAREALQLFMAYGASVLRVSRFVAKIGDANAPSLALFASLGFSEVGHSAVFKEVTLELPVEGSVRGRLLATQLQLGTYDDE
jgi:L-amino acid N-acyltransferase YncA